MATYKFLKDLSIGQDNDCIKVRITREWEGKKTGSSYVISKNYILLDEEGSQIQASPLHRSLIALFTKNLKLGEVYMISTFNVGRAANTYRPVPGEFVINFHRNTETKQLSEIHTIPRFKFHITDFEEARKKKGDVINLMDVVGKVIKVTDLYTAKNGKKIVDVVLANERDDTLKITLWEDQARTLLEFEAEYSKPNVFVIVTSTSTKYIEGTYVLWSCSSTQYFFNMSHPDLVELTKNYKMEEELIPAIVPFITTQNQTMPHTIERITIAQLFKAQLPNGANNVSFTTEATVIGIDVHRRWYYIGCNKCYKKMHNSLICNNCTHNTTPIPLFMVTAEVKDSTSDTTFVLFERHVLKLINVSAQHILNNDKNANQDVVPAVLNNILGKKCVFKLSLTSKNTKEHFEGYTVTEVEEITNEPSLSATSQIVDRRQKRKLTTQEENYSISNETFKVFQNSESTIGSTSDTGKTDETPPQVSDVIKKADHGHLTKSKK